MSLGTILSRMTGLLRLTAITAALGVAEGRLADAYNLANTVPNLIYNLFLGGILASVFVPVFVEMLEKEGHERAWEAASALINVALVVLTAITAIGVLAAPWIAKFYAVRLEGNQAQLQEEVITFLLRLFVPQIIFYGLGAITAGLLNAHKRFGAPMYTPVLGNIGVIAAFVIFHQAYGRVDLNASATQLWIIGLATTLGVAVMALAQLPFLRGLGHYRLTFSLGHPSIKKVARLSLFVIAYMGVTQFGYLIVQWLANGEQGGYSAYVAAYTFYLLPISLFVLSVTTALLPDMSGHAVNERWDAFRDRLSLGIRATLFLVLPAATGYLVLGRPIVELLLENGVMTARSTDLVSEVLAFMALGLPQGAVFMLLIRSFYSMQDTKTPFLVVCWVTGFNILINVPLFSWMGVGGLALGQALANTLGILLLGRALAARIGGLDAQRVRESAARVVAAAAGMALLVWLAWLVVERFVGGADLGAELLSVGLPVGLGIVSYLALAHLLRVEELGYVRRLFGGGADADRAAASAGDAPPFM